MRFSDLDPDAKSDFKQRLSLLDVDETAILADELELGEDERVDLRFDGSGRIKPHIMTTSDLDKVRQWVGVPDVVDRNRFHRPIARLRSDLTLETRPKRVRSSIREARATNELETTTGVKPSELMDSVRRYREASEDKRREVKPSADQLEVLRVAARTYVHGDKEAVAPYKQAIEAYFVNFEIAAWLFTTVHVKKNATLTFGPGAHNLTAYQVIVEEGGRVVSYGHLNVNATKLEGPPKLSVVLPPPHIVSRSEIERRHF